MGERPGLSPAIMRGILSAIASVTLLFVVSLAPQPARSASRFGPPTEMMLEGHNKVAVALAREGSVAGRVRFELLESIHGEIPQSWEARVEMDDLSDIEWGKEYVVAFTEVRKDPLLRGTRELDPEGPRVLELPVLRAVLLRHRREVVTMLQGVQVGGEKLGREYLEAALALLASDDQRLRRFAVTELYLRQELSASLRKGDAPVIRAVAASESVESEPRALLLEASRRFPAEVSGSWPQEVSREIVASAATELDLGSTEPLLLKTALQILVRGEPAAGDVEIVARQLESNSPGVAKAAIVALEQLDPDEAARRAREILASNRLHPSIRQAFEALLRRYDDARNPR